jgi:hypothetical protein
MSTTLSKGYRQPENGDRSWYGDLNFNIERLNDHQHDGVDSAQIQLRHIVKQSQVIADTDWGPDLGGATYSYSVTMPSGLAFTDAQLRFVEVTGTNTGVEIHPTVIQTAAGAFDVLVNDNTMTVKVIYG